MAKKERIVHEYELERPLMAPDPEQVWWEKDDGPPDHGGTHGASGVGTRAVRLTAKKPGWGKILLLLLLVALVLGAFLLMINDLRGGKSGGDPNPTVSQTQSKIDNKLPSPDTIKVRLEKAGYKVDFLDDAYDRTEHGYDVADTEIEGHKAQILAFPDKATTDDFAVVAANTRYTIIKGKLWAISFGQRQEHSIKRLAEEIANKLNAVAIWTPEGE